MLFSCNNQNLYRITAYLTLKSAKSSQFTIHIIIPKLAVRNYNNLRIKQNSMKTKKELKEEFKSIKFRVGIYQILNKVENKMFLQTSLDLDRAHNSDIFQLKEGMHSNKTLQKNWDNLVPQAFEFNTFDEPKIKETEDAQEINKDLKELLEMHLIELKRNGQLLY